MTMQEPNPYLNYLIGASFQLVNRPFVSLFENDDYWTSYKQYFYNYFNKYYKLIAIDLSK